MADRSADELLALWASRRLSLFFIFGVPGKSGGSTVCVIEEFSNDRLRLSWPGETNLSRPGEFIISLKEASRTISDIDVSDLISGSDFIDSKEPFFRKAHFCAATSGMYVFWPDDKIYACWEGIGEEHSLLGTFGLSLVTVAVSLLWLLNGGSPPLYGWTIGLFALQLIAVFASAAWATRMVLWQ